MGPLGPLAGDNVISHALLHQVHGDHGKLLMGAALQEQNLIVIRDIQQIPQICLGLVENVLVSLGAVAHLHD